MPLCQWLQIANRPSGPSPTVTVSCVTLARKRGHWANIGPRGPSAYLDAAMSTRARAGGPTAPTRLQWRVRCGIVVLRSTSRVLASCILQARWCASVRTRIFAPALCSGGSGGGGGPFTTLPNHSKCAALCIRPATVHGRTAKRCAAMRTSDADPKALATIDSPLPQHHAKHKL